MGFEIRDGHERLPDEEDIYGVDDIEDQDRFNSLMGNFKFTQDARFARRRLIITLLALILLSIATLGILGYIPQVVH